MGAKSRASFDHLPDGTYRIQYALGGALAQGCRSFVHAYAVNELPQPVTMAEEYRAGGVLYDRITYTIFAERTRAGNVRPKPLSVLDFDAE